MAVKLWIPFILLLIVNITKEYGNWNPNRRPKLMGDKIPFKDLNPVNDRVKRKILIFHNFFRSKVKPVASNMLKLKWHSGAAYAAQRWADQCKFLVHDNKIGRYIRNYGPCGQNIFIATHKVPWLFAIKTWWLEKDQFNFGKPDNNLTIIGHYTQMVWAATHKVGCGIAECYHHWSNSNRTKVFYNYVCNYCPIGNRPGKSDHPYEVGTPCEKCQTHCKRKLCLNSCPYANRWSNCEKLHKRNPYWLCNTKSTQGRQRFLHCRATCSCHNRIYD